MKLSLIHIYKQAYVDEEMFAADDTVTSIKVDDADYEVTTITQDIIISLSRATLVTPTTSTPVQDNTSLIPPLVFHLASTRLGRDTQR